MFNFHLIKYNFKLLWQSFYEVNNEVHISILLSYIGFKVGAYKRKRGTSRPPDHTNTSLIPCREGRSTNHAHLKKYREHAWIVEQLLMKCHEAKR
jgi:hypothetical protein